MRLGALFLGLAVFAAQPAQALGVGRPLTLSALGQPLQLVFPLRLSGDETLSPDCVRAEVLAGESRVPPPLVQTQLDGETSATVRSVRILTVTQIDEPIVTVNLSLGCPLRFARQFTAFIDPPGQQPPPDNVPGEAPLRSYTPAMQAALATADARPAALLAPEAASAAGRAEAPALLAATPGAAASAAKTRPPAKRARSAGAPRATSAATSAVAQARSPRARLQLEPAELPGGPPAPADAASLAASAAGPVDQGETSQQRRLQTLEQRLAQLQAEQGSAQLQIKALQAQLEQARAERFSHPLVIALALGMLAFAGTSFYFWQSRRQERAAHESVWWSEVRAETKARLVGDEPRAPAAARAPVAAPAPAEAPGFESNTMSGTLLEDEEQSGHGAMPIPVAAVPETPDTNFSVLARSPDAEHEPLSIQLLPPDWPGAAPPPAPGLFDAGDAAWAEAAAAPPVSVEEMIDLEQQVEFFRVLGQDEAAIELLAAHVNSGRQVSALPYLKLLEIYQHRGEAAAFERVSRSFGERFQTVAPRWDADVGGGGGLESRPEVLARIQAQWANPGACMALLQELLAHGDLAGGEDGRGFDLPAYRELLMLYAVARDLSEREVRGDAVDLFLPLDAPGANRAAQGMMATMVWQSPIAPAVGQAGPASPPAVDLDLSLAAPEDGDALSKGP